MAGEARQARRARRADQSRREIMRAAARCFMQAGYDATTMRAIADEAGFTASSLYTYFDGKEEIFAALVEEVSDSCRRVMEQPLPSGMTFDQKLELLFMRFLDWTEAHREAVLFIMAQGRSMEEEDFRFIDAFVHWVEANSTKKERGGHTPEDVACFIWGTMHGFFMQWLAEGAERKLGEKVRTILSLILKGLNR